MNLEQAKLQKRAKELDAQQEFIETQQKLLDEAPLTFKVYKAKIANYENKVKQVVDSIAKKTTDGTKAVEELTAKRSQLISQNQAIESDTNKKRQELKELNEKCTRSQKDLKDINKTIEERHKYHESQEDIINKTIEEGNDHLIELQSISDDFENKAKKIKVDIVELEKQRDELIIQKDSLEKAYEAKISDLISQIKTLEIERKKIADYIAESTSAYKEISKKIDAKLLALKEKEGSIQAQRDALILDIEKFNTERRRWNSKIQLYEVK